MQEKEKINYVKKAINRLFQDEGRIIAYRLTGTIIFQHSFEE